MDAIVEVGLAAAGEEPEERDASADHGFEEGESDPKPYALAKPSLDEREGRLAMETGGAHEKRAGAAQKSVCE
jgi:hypothetical protein